ncbi:MAG: LytTR family transcriptional regulator [Dysgonamonadaceae bacterium]|jgi:DNA-binding LytR/AlgR family response regulator|nr:LytTR family transcriptional regulator [Dysgonamonadaceae bacterium]
MDTKQIHENNERSHGELLNFLLQLRDSSCKSVNTENKTLYIWDNGKLIRIETDKIAYLEAARCYCEINMTDSRKFVPTLPLSKVAAYLPESHFARVHRSFVVNRDLLNEICGNMIILPNKKQLPIGREYRKTLLNSLTIINTKNKKYFP